MLRREYSAMFEDCFRKQYALIHRLETNKLRNVARLFSHLMSTDAISWGVLQVCWVQLGFGVSNIVKFIGKALLTPYVHRRHVLRRAAGMLGRKLPVP